MARCRCPGPQLSFRSSLGRYGLENNGLRSPNVRSTALPALVLVGAAAFGASAGQRPAAPPLRRSKPASTTRCCRRLSRRAPTPARSRSPRSSCSAARAASASSRTSNAGSSRKPTTSISCGSPRRGTAAAVADARARLLHGRSARQARRDRRRLLQRDPHATATCSRPKRSSRLSSRSTASTKRRSRARSIRSPSTRS